MSIRTTSTAAAFAAPSAPAAERQQAYEMERRSYIVKTRVGKLYVEVVHPTKDGKIVAAKGTYWLQAGAFPGSPIRGAA